MAIALNFECEDLQGFADSLAKLGGVPQRCVTKAARQGATAVKSRISAMAPVRTRSLKRGMELRGERHRGKRGKKVYEVRFRRDMNDVFQKTIKAPGTRGGSGKPSAYYHSSVEYGFMTRHPEGGFRYVEGQHFMRAAAEAIEPTVQRMMMRSLCDEMEKEWVKRNNGH